MMMILIERIPESNIFSTIHSRSGNNLDKEFNTVMWLECETVMECGKKMVRALKCSVCSKYKKRIESSRNFSEKWIISVESLRTSNIRDHRKNN